MGIGNTAAWISTERRGRDRLAMRKVSQGAMEDWCRMFVEIIITVFIAEWSKDVSCGVGTFATVSR